MNHSRPEDQEDFVPGFAVALSAAILSLVLGFSAIISNGLLLLAMYKDPLRYFRSRATSYFVFSLALSDLLGGLFIQFLYSTFLFGVHVVLETTCLRVLYDIVSVASHLTTKISILTVVALSIDRYFAVKLGSRYTTLVTVKKAIICSVFIWLVTASFETTHSASATSELFHTIDLHMQTTFPLITLFIVYLATYFNFRRHARNTVLSREGTPGISRFHQRNSHLEKRIAVTVVLIFVVLFISLIPYLLVNDFEEQCHDSSNEERGCLANRAFVTAKTFSVTLLGVSCALNPFFYAFRISHYNHALRRTIRSLRQKTLGHSHGVTLPSGNNQPVPAFLRKDAE